MQDCSNKDTHTVKLWERATKHWLWRCISISEPIWSNTMEVIHLDDHWNLSIGSCNSLDLLGLNLWYFCIMQNIHQMHIIEYYKIKYDLRMVLLLSWEVWQITKKTLGYKYGNKRLATQAYHYISIIQDMYEKVQKKFRTLKRGIESRLLNIKVLY